MLVQAGRRRIARTLLAALAVGSFGVPWASGAADVAGAQATPTTVTAPAAERTWGVQPSSATGPTDRAAFQYELAPGDTVEDWIGVTNHGSEPIELRVYASDAFTTPEGGFDLLASDKPPVDVGAWVTLQTSRVRLEPGARVDVPFTLTVPANATPGDHTGGVVAAYVSGSDSASGALMVEQRVGARVYLRVEGALRPELQVEELTVEPHSGVLPWGGSATVTYTVRNTGNVRLAGRQHLDVSGVVGLGGGSIELPPLPELLPGGSHEVRAEADGLWATGRTRAQLRIEPVAADVDLAATITPIERSVASTEVPWAFLSLVAITAMVAWWAAHHRPSRPRPASASAGGGPAAGAEPVPATSTARAAASTVTAGSTNRARRDQPPGPPNSSR